MNNRLKYFYSIIAALLLSNFVFSQEIKNIDPPNWWVGMKYNRIELLIHGSDIGFAQFETAENDIAIHKVSFNENRNYAFIDLEIMEDAKPGMKIISYTLKKKKYQIYYEIKARERSASSYVGLTQSDAIYLITPDRFANGNIENDMIKAMKDNEFGRDKIESRHGGDIEGVIKHLDYIKQLGMTATWLNPIEENDQNRASYHGYGITNSYLLDARFGTNSDYQRYVDESHKRKLKVIKDVVYNHFGVNHYLIKDLPSSDWINNWGEYTASNYRASVLFDPYASKKDFEKMSKGWFDTTMADLNQQNQQVARYLIQSSIWWIENFGIDAYRIDTYAYSDQRFMSALSKTILDEYPNFTIFGETWVSGVPTQAWFTSGKKNGKDFDSFMDGITDFNLQYAIRDAVNEETGWNTGLAKIYYTLAWDYLYDKPEANVIFLDNHDIDRFLSTINNDLQSYHMALTILFTTRGIPQLYYGGEINMNRAGHHGYLREDFSGGWKSDILNKFTKEGRSVDENSTWNLISTLANWRKTSKAIAEGKLVQFVPENGIYVYFRDCEDELVMVIVNSNKEEKTFDYQRYNEMLKQYQTAFDVVKQKNADITNLVLEKRKAYVFSIKK